MLVFLDDLDWWDNVATVGVNVASGMLLMAAPRAFTWLKRSWSRRSEADRSIATRIGPEAIEGVPSWVKVALYKRMAPAQEQAARLISKYGEVEPAMADGRAGPVVESTVAQVVMVWKRSKRLGRLRFAIGFPLIFKCFLGHHVYADLEAHEELVRIGDLDGV